MDITSTTSTIRKHRATATVDMLKGVAIAAMTKQLGLAESVVMSSTGTVGADGSISVEIVEAVADAPKVETPQPPAGPTI